MRMLLVLLVIVALAPPNASSVVDPDPDGIGVYFDVNAENVHTWVGPTVVFDAYVILTNPSANELEAFEFLYDLVVPPGMEGLVFRLSYTFPDCPNCFEFFENEVVLGLPAPVSLENPHVLMHLQYILLAPVEAQFFLGPTSGEPGTSGQLAYWSEAGMITMHPSSGHSSLPVAMINSEGVVPVTETTFGSLKALYR